jgi:type I restriction enzyme M protein
MNLVGDGTTGIFCEDSLELPQNWRSETRNKIQLESFDIVLTNPPFGSKIPVVGYEKLKQYDLAHQWKKNKDEGGWDKHKIKDKEAPQILFIERCFQLLKDGGKMAIVLPEGTFGNTDLGYIRKFILERARLIAVIDVPLETFMPNTGTKTSILIVQKLSKKEIPPDYPVFMAIAETCGHDRRGNEKELDDISEIANQFKEWKKKVNLKF